MYVSRIYQALEGGNLDYAVFAKAIRSAVGQWRQGRTPEEAVLALADPTVLAASLLPMVQAQCTQAGVLLPQLQSRAQQDPYTHLPDVFDALNLVDTPIAFLPVPPCEGTILARAAAIAVMAALNHQVVSYGSENDGVPFVNLVVIPGEGRTADKSKGPMRGHTDAVSFPPRGHLDPERENIAPSPDFVCLVGLKNPDLVETTVMPMPAILARLSPKSIGQLELQQFQIRAQATFLQGTKRTLGEAHIADGVAVLYGIDGQLGVRYSHTNVLAEESADADAALQELQQACSECVEKVVVNPGDILLVNNRFALHGRSQVGEHYGGQSRWLLRTYGLLKNAARSDQYHQGSNFMLFP